MIRWPWWSRQSPYQRQLAPGLLAPLEVAVEMLGDYGEQGADCLESLAHLLEARPGLYIPDDMLLEIADVMIRLAPDDPIVVPAYAARLGAHFDRRVRIESAIAIGHFGEDSAAAVPDLVQATSDPIGAVVREAITALGMIGPAAKDAIPTLEALTEHEDPQPAARAKAALRQVRGR